MDLTALLTADRFDSYGRSHLTVLALIVAVSLTLVWFGRRLRGTSRGRQLDRAFAVALLAVTVPLQVRQLLPERFDVDNLPIQLCDLASLAAVYALWTHRWWAAALTYYWGLTLTLQAILTPDVSADFPSAGFLLYWGMHGLIVVAAVHLTWGDGLGPTWAGYRLTLLATAAWAVAAYVVNAGLGTNYGFLNDKPDSASLLDLFGPWPWYLVVEAAVVAGGWALLTWPWAGWPVRRERSAPA